MQLAARHLYLAVFLALLVGHASVAVHAASHVADDVAKCELCIAYSNSLEGLPGETGQGIYPAADSHTPVRALEAPSSADTVPYRTRGPPVSD